MKKENKLNRFVIIGILYFVILLTISTAYSFFNTDLSLKATVGTSTSADNYKTSYILQANWYDGNSYNYHFIPTLTYLDSKNTVSWKLYIKVPFDTEITGCYSAESCVVEGEILTITNDSTNGILTPESNSVTMGFQMKTNQSDYTFEVVGASFINKLTNEDNEYIRNNNITNIDYISPVLEITGGWNSITTYTFKVTNNSSDTTILSWSANLVFPTNSTINSLWGGTYQYDASTGILTLHGPDWAPTLPPNSSIEVNLYIDTNVLTPYTPTVEKFIGVTPTGEKIQTNIKIGGNS